MAARRCNFLTFFSSSRRSFRSSFRSLDDRWIAICLKLVFALSHQSNILCVCFSVSQLFQNVVISSVKIGSARSVLLKCQKPGPRSSCVRSNEIVIRS